MVGFTRLRRGMWLFAVVAFFAGASLCAQNFDFDQARQPVATLNGVWRFHPGDDSRWAAPDLDDSAWPLLKSDRSWDSQGYPRLSGFAWYRFTIRIPAGAPPLSILMAPVFTGYTLFLDGRIIGTSGAYQPSPFITDPTPRLYALTTEPASVPRTLHMAARCWHSPIWAGYAPGGPFDRSTVGESSLLTRQLQLIHDSVSAENVDLYVDSILRAVVGLVILGLFLLRTREREYLWFALIQLFGCANDVLTLLEYVSRSMPVQLYDLVDAATAAGFWIACLYFFAVVFAVRRGFWFRCALVLAALSPLLVPLYWWGWLSVPLDGLLSAALVLPSLVWVMRLLLVRAWRRDTDALLLIVPAFLLNGFYVVWNIVLAGFQFGLWKLSDPDMMQWRFHVYPFDFGWYTLFNIIMTVALLAFLIRRFSQARQKEEQLESQIEAARQVQQILVPSAAVHTPGFRVDCVYLPAESVGGDFFQQLQDAEGRLVLIVGDVAGKGLPAAMMVSMLVGAARTEARRSSDPEALLASLNDRMLERGDGAFATCLIARISADGRLEIANAGHLPPWRNGQLIDLPGSLPLGIAAYRETSLHSFDLASGDHLAFVSDGVIEAQNRSGELFGFDRAGQISGRPAEEISRAAQSFGQQDDITVVTVEFLGHSALVRA